MCPYFPRVQHKSVHQFLIRFKNWAKGCRTPQRLSVCGVLTSSSSWEGVRNAGSQAPSRPTATECGVSSVSACQQALHRILMHMKDEESLGQIHTPGLGYVCTRSFNLVHLWRTKLIGKQLEFHQKGILKSVQPRELFKTPRPGVFKQYPFMKDERRMRCLPMYSSGTLSHTPTCATHTVAAETTAGKVLASYGRRRSYTMEIKKADIAGVKFWLRYFLMRQPRASYLPSLCLFNHL